MGRGAASLVGAFMAPTLHQSAESFQGGHVGLGDSEIDRCQVLLHVGPVGGPGERHHADGKGEAYAEGYGARPRPPLGEMPALPEPMPLLRRPTEGEDIVADYGSLGLTLRRHPLALLRPVLTRPLSSRSTR